MKKNKTKKQIEREKQLEIYSEMVANGIEIWKLPKKDRPKGIVVVGVIPDMHIPFHNPKALDFLKHSFRTRGVTTIVAIGDIVDNYWRAGKYIKDYNVMGPREEYEESLKYLELMYKEFPEVYFCIGNHEQRLTARQNDGFVDDFEETFRRTFRVPKAWKIAMEHEIDGVLYTHGIGATGQNAALTMMRTKRQSTVIGHTHTFAGVQYSNNGRETIFALNVGSLIDMNASVFKYGINNREKPVQSCGVVYSKEYAEIIPLVEKGD